MFEKLEAIERTYEELTQQMTDPAVIGDQARYTKVAKQSREIEPVVEKFRELRKLDRDIAGAKELMRDAEDEEMREIAAAELPELEERRAGVEWSKRFCCCPKTRTMKRT